MTKSPVNRFGRKGGRGIRPWLLIPKVIAVMIYIGGLTAALGLWIGSDFSSFDLSDPRRKLVLDQVGHLMVFLVVPALLAAMGFGVALLLQHPAQFLRMRWLQVKLIGLVILIPLAHLFCRSRMVALRQATDAATNQALAHQLRWGLGLTLAGSIVVVILGRLKPRLGTSPVQSKSVS
jgi:hypothetical protein